MIRVKSPYSDRYGTLLGGPFRRRDISKSSVFEPGQQPKSIDFFKVLWDDGKEQEVTGEQIIIATQEKK